MIGSGGAGKSVFGMELGRRTGLPVIHLDREFWSPGWTPMPEEASAEHVRELVLGERWGTDETSAFQDGTADPVAAAA